jgi:hypothetical protein
MVWNRNLIALLVAGAAACGDAGSSDPHPLSFGADSLVLHSGMTTALAVSAGGSQTAASSLVWASSNSLVARVSAAGTIVAGSPGQATITAAGTAGAASLSVRVASDLDAGAFRPPLAASVSVASPFDHDLPFEFSDNNGFLLSFWGEHLSGIDGHNGYDWAATTGTPVLAAGDGTVTFAGNETPFVCTLLNNTTVSGLWVNVQHGLSDGHVVVTQYGHFSQIAVKAGDRVTAGQQLGLSGTTGCSTGPHLHFSTFVLNAAHTAAIVMDPYGWQSTTADTWANDPRGTASLALWSGANAPQLYREFHRTGAYPKPKFVDMKTLRYLGVDDAHNPNNEFVEIDVNPDLPSWDFGRDTLRNTHGDFFIFPAGFVLPGGGTVRVYSGVGASTTTTLYMGRPAPMWGNLGDCAVLADTLQRTLTGILWGTATPTCGTASANVVHRTDPMQRDVSNPALKIP